MPLNPQTSPFPPIYQPEQGWEHSLRKSVGLLFPSQGIRSGLELGLPLASNGTITTGLTPTLTSGLLVSGDKIYGPLGPRVTAAATPGLSNRNIYFGLKGFSYGDANNAAPLVTDVLLGSLSTDSAGTPSIQHLGQQYLYGGTQFGVRGVINLAKCPKGADTTFFTWTLPDIGLKNVRIAYAQARVFEAAASGNATGDDFVLKAKVGSDAASSLVTVAAAGLTLNNIVRSATPLSWYNPASILFQYNQTDVSANLTGGGIEVMIGLVVF